MILRDVMVPGKELECEICSYVWVSISSDKLPEFCPNRLCRSREWNGKKKRGAGKITLPKPTKIKWVEEETDF